MAISQELENAVLARMGSTAAGVEMSTLLNAVSALSGTETGYIDGVTPGTALASKAVVLDANKAFRIGQWAASGAATNAVVLSAALDIDTQGQVDVLSVFGASTANLGSGYSAKVGRFRHVATVSVAHETYGLIGQMVVKSATLSHLHAGLMGTLEINTAATVPAGDAIGAAGVIARVGGATITVGSTGMLAGFLSAQLATTVSITSGGVHAAFACRKVGSGITWAEALHIEDALVAIRFKAADNSYAHGVKALAKKLDASNTSYCIKIMIGTTAAYVPAFAGEWNT